VLSKRGSVSVLSGQNVSIGALSGALPPRAITAFSSARVFFGAFGRIRSARR
jgi:hypothetical protein